MAELRRRMKQGGVLQKLGGGRHQSPTTMFYSNYSMRRPLYAVHRHYFRSSVKLPRCRHDFRYSLCPLNAQHPLPTAFRGSQGDRSHNSPDFPAVEVVVPTTVVFAEPKTYRIFGLPPKTFDTECSHFVPVVAFSSPITPSGFPSLVD